jgi:Leucine-rich repeat (LRR) protein
LRCLHIESNALSRLDGLEELTELTQLYVDGNILENLAGIERLRKLRHLNANDNSLSTLEHVRDHPSLQTIFARGNRIRTPAAFAALRTCALLTSLDVAQNDIDDVTVLDEIKSIPSIELLYFARGNQAAGALEGYRHVLTSALPSLRWLDDAEIDAEIDRRRADAHLRGGSERELAEIRTIRAEREASLASEHRAFPAACAEFIAECSA